MRRGRAATGGQLSNSPHVPPTRDISFLHLGWVCPWSSKKFKFTAWLVVAAALTLGQPARSQPAATSQATAPESVAVMDWINRLKPGEFLWWPQLAPSGPVMMMINRTTQRAVLYRNGVPIGVSTVSTGREGHRTPPGVFVILEKQVKHFSSIYDNAPMPFMQRLTWGGVALHGGQLPGYPASHGCIRLPLAFARLIYPETRLGMTVTITDAAALPALVLGDPIPGNDAAFASDAISRNPQPATGGPVTIVVSEADRRVLVLQDGHLLGAAPVELKALIEHPQLFVLESLEGDTQHWVPATLNGEEIAGARSPWELLSLPDSFKAQLQPLLAPTVRLVIVPDHIAR